MVSIENCPESALENKDDAEKKSWFTVFNHFYGPLQTVTYQFPPFPAEEFPPISPWEHCVIIAHFGIEPYAAAAGFDSVDKYLKQMIKEAGTRT